MKKITLIIVLLVTSAYYAKAQTPRDAILGTWLSEKKDSKFEIYKRGEVFFGKILSGEGESKDVKNPDPALRNRDLIGLVILKDFTFDGKSSWEDGTIYDPRKGKTYDCIITLQDKNTLKVRGYIGLSLFGRTEIWSRTQP